MIGRIRGELIEKLLDKAAPELLVDVAGVCYEVLVPMTTVYHLPELGDKVVLHTHFSVSENAQTLFGFVSLQDRELFRTLIKVNGVGPKMALGILSGMEAKQLVRCLLDGNVAALVKVPGVGKKTAERLVMEVADKVRDWQSGSDNTAESINANAVAGPASLDSVRAEAESALLALGYKPVEASRMIAAALEVGEAESAEALIRMALRNLATV